MEGDRRAGLGSRRKRVVKEDAEFEKPSEAGTSLGVDSTGVG